ncbi:sensor histidine kinase [Planctomycetota bacterium]
MEHLLLSSSLTRRAFWLVELRWVATAALVITITVSKKLMGIALPTPSLYLLSGIIFVYNILIYSLLKILTIRLRGSSGEAIGRIITFQISIDLVILTAILHFSGGIENPFFLFFVFHMIIASILRSRGQSYLQATLAVFLLGGMVLLECYGHLPNYPLTGFVETGLYAQQTYVLSFLFVFSITLYLIVYMTTSIAAQLRAQQESLEQANAQLEEKDTIKNNYVLRVTHDIKGHLAAIESLVTIVNDEMVGPLNDKQKDLVDRAHRRTVKCMAFIQALLRLTRMKLAGERPQAEFSLRSTLDTALEAVQNLAQKKSIVITTEIAPDVNRIYGEPMMIEETITNMLFNAVKYTPNGGRVTLTAAVNDGWFRVQISDTGIGIPERDLDKVFEEFYRAENARVSERDGTGLGLSFARAVIERHGGQVSAQNNAKVGCTFTISLPAQSVEK